MIANGQAPSYGSRVPVDTAPAPVPVHKAPKVYPASQLSRPTAGPHRCMNTATSTTMEELHLRHLLLHTNGHVNNSVQASTSCNCGISTVSSPPAPEEFAGPAQPGRRTLCQWTATGESQWSAELDQGKRPLRHDSDVNDLDMQNNGHVNHSKVHSLALYVPVSA